MSKPISLAAVISALLLSGGAAAQNPAPGATPTDDAGITELSAESRGDSLRCLGTQPGFMVELAGRQGRFDYLGDGTFELNPELDLDRDYAGYFLHTYSTDIPLYLNRDACPMFRATLPYRIELVVRTSAGPVAMVGCCVLVGGTG